MSYPYRNAFQLSAVKKYRKEQNYGRENGKDERHGNGKYTDKQRFYNGICFELFGGNVHLRRFEIGFKLSFFELVELHVLCKEIRKVSEPYIQR